MDVAIAVAELSPAASGQTFRSITFDLDGQTQLFGWLHPAATAHSRRCGVVLCNPFAYDALSVHRTYRVLAESLAQQGYPTLRFDYHGTGDSAGSDADPDRLAAWIASIDSAIDTCKQLCGIDEVVLFGVRFGATMAVSVAARRNDVKALMLWAPVVSGRKLIRQLRMLHGTSAAQASTVTVDSAPSDAFDGVEAAGFRHTSQTLSDIGAIDLLKVPAPRVPTLLIDRDDVPQEPALADYWHEAGVTLDMPALPGYAAMMRDAQYSTVPESVIEALSRWLPQTLPDLSDIAAQSLTAPRDVLTSAPATCVMIRERPIWFGGDHKLWGILSRPDAAPNALANTAVILVNAGGNHRIGPSRLTVPVARYVASLGCTTLRMDLAGLGDSVPLNKLPIFDLNSVTDVEQAMDYLSGLGPTPLRRFVLIGLCSGGFVAMHTAIRDPRVNSQVIMNLPAFDASPSSNAETVAKLYIKPFSFYAQAILQPQTWLRALRGGIDFRRIIAGSTARLTRRFAVKQRAMLSKLKLSKDFSIAAQFQALCRRGVRTLIILSADDGAVDEMETHLGSNAQKMQDAPEFKHVILAGADHTFTSDTARRNLLETLRQHFESLITQKI